MNKLIHLPARTLKIALIAVPMLLYGMYLLLIAADRYVSESVVAVRQEGSESAAGIPGAALLLAGLGGASSHDTLYVREFVHSRDLMIKLESQLKLREHFGSAGADLPYRLRSGGSQEDLVDYFRARVHVSYDDRSGLLKLRVEGFDPAYAQKLNRAILDESERFVNESSHQVARERLRFAEGELDRAGKRLLVARNDLLAFQSKNKLLDPLLQAQASGVLSAELEGSRARLEAELNGLLGYLHEDSYQVKALRGRIAALDKQIDVEQSRATVEGPRSGGRLNQLALDFQALQMQTEFARDAYKLALIAVENARIESTRKIKSLVVVEPPSLPQTAEYPLVAYNLTTLLVICLLTYAIVRLALATVREHMD